MARFAGLAALLMLGSAAAASLGSTAAAQWNTEVASEARPVATRASVSGDEQRTRFRLDLSRAIEVGIYTLTDPDRVVIDMPDVLFKLPGAAGQSGHGLVATFRYGLFSAGKSRLVIDTTGPVRVENIVRSAAKVKEPAHLAFDIVSAAPAAVQAPAQQPARAAAAAEHQPDLRGANFEQALRQAAPEERGPGLRGAKFEQTAAAPEPRGAALPVIVIDPGHGGIDPGTVAEPNVTEKHVVLAIARQLAAKLTAGRRYQVHMTRSADVFVSLDERIKLSQQVGADLFVSLHADALPERDAGAAQNVRGATVYTLSARASDEVARRLAERENASDALAGLDTEKDDQLRLILIDLMRQETSNLSAEFRAMLVQKLKGRIALARDPKRAAAFKVLRQADTPAVLVELGYMSNSEDRGKLTSPDWHKQVAGALSEAIDVYFAKRLAGAPR